MMLKNLPRHSSSIFSVNLLYLLTVLLNFILGSWMQSLHFSLGLIASEVILVLIPTIVFLRLRHIPLKEGLRINSIHLLIGLLCVLLGFTTYLFVVFIDAVMAQMIALPNMLVSVESVIPNGIVESVGLFIAVAIVVPLCEESLFRGVIQAAYEKRRPASSAIAIVALMFAFWHFKLSGLFGLLLEASILGYVAWRSGSIIASILMHFGLNATSSANLLLALNTGKGLPFLGPPAAVTGLLVTAVLIYLFWRLTPARAQPAPVEPDQPRSWLWDNWPLMAAGVIFLVVIVQTFMIGNITLSQAGYNKVQIDQVLESRYQITDQAGEHVGEMDCALTPQGANIRLDCSGRVKADDITTSSGVVTDEAHTTTWSATWSTDHMSLLDFSYEQSYADAASNFRATVEDGRLVVENSTGIQEIALSPGDLVEYEWAWRVNALKPQVVTTIEAPYAYLLWWDEPAQKWHPALRNEVLQLTKSELLNLPAGQFQTHKASLGGQSAWYADDHAGPVRFEDATLIYELEK